MSVCFAFYQLGLCSVSYTANEYSIYHFCIIIKDFFISFSSVIIVQDFETVTFYVLSLEKTNMFHYMQKAWNQRGISVELAWNPENSTLIPYCGSFKFHITYAEAGYQLWNYSVIYMELKVIQPDCGKKCEIKVELTFRRINSTLWNSFESSLSGVNG